MHRVTIFYGLIFKIDEDRIVVTLFIRPKLLVTNFLIQKAE